MKRIALAGLFALGYTNAAERYILQYDKVVWDNFHPSMLPDNTVRILHNLQMTVADLSADEISLYESVPGITVYKDEPVYLFAGKVQDDPESWGIDRIDQRELPLDQKYHYGTDGTGVDVYVVDTGVYAEHNEFGGRASFDKNFADDDEDRDCHGHGTHVGSTIAGVNVGIAKNARVHGVKVLSCSGSGTTSGVVAGIDYVAGEHKKNAGQKSVLNMSLGGLKQLALNAAVDAAAEAGVVVVVAAGNDGADACRYSPASAEGAITAAASDIQDESAYFTNHGKCVDLYGPGVDIVGAWIGGKDEYYTASGTSMASPHVAGVATLILSSGQASTPEEVRAKLAEVATKDIVEGVPSNTPNLLLYADPVWGEDQAKNTFWSLNGLRY